MVVAGVVSFLMPKIYRGEVIVKVNIKATITPKEFIEIVGKMGDEKKANIFIKNHDSVGDVKITEIRGSTDKLRIIIDSTRPEDIQSCFTEIVEYMNNSPEAKLFIEQTKERLSKEIEEISVLIAQSEALVKALEKTLKDGKLVAVGFNPIELNRKASDLKIEKLNLEHQLINLKAVKIIEGPSISKKPVKPKVKQNIAIASIISLLLGVILAFFMEFLEKNKAVFGKPA